MMERLITTISSILGIIGFVITLLSISNIQSNAISFFGGVLLTITCIGIYYFIKRLPKYTEIEGIRIEAADEIPLFVPRKNVLNPIRVTHTCQIVGCDAILDYEYFGICSSKRGCDQFSTSLFSHDISEIEKMDWSAYDLKNDPERINPLKPVRTSPKGTTCRVKFNFIRRIKYNTSFHYFTHQIAKNSIKKTGKDYYVSTIFYCNKPLSEYHVYLKFFENPKYVKVYSIDHKKSTFLYQLTDYNSIDDTYVYADHITDATSWSIRCYIFER